MRVLLFDTIEAAVVTAVDCWSFVGKDEEIVGVNLSRRVLYRGKVVVVFVVVDEDEDEEEGESKQKETTYLFIQN
jgi:hypothetical protein